MADKRVEDPRILAEKVPVWLTYYARMGGPKPTQAAKNFAKKFAKYHNGRVKAMIAEEFYCGAGQANGLFAEADREPEPLRSQSRDMLSEFFSISLDDRVIAILNYYGAFPFED